MSKISDVLTQERIEHFQSELSEIKTKRGPVIMALQMAQAIFGCCPIEVLRMISEELNVSIAKLNGVVTFYSQFTTEPQGEKIVSVCMGTACYVRGSQAVMDKAEKTLGIKPGETTKDMKYTLVGTRCIGACGLAPVMTVNEEVYGNIPVSDVQDAILGGESNEG